VPARHHGERQIARVLLKHDLAARDAGVIARLARDGLSNPEIGNVVVGGAGLLDARDALRTASPVCALNDEPPGLISRSSAAPHPRSRSGYWAATAVGHRPIRRLRNI
jgi:hypothetical protein